MKCKIASTTEHKIFTVLVALVLIFWKKERNCFNSIWSTPGYLSHHIEVKRSWTAILL